VVYKNTTKKCYGRMIIPFPLPTAALLSDAEHCTEGRRGCLQLGPFKGRYSEVALLLCFDGFNVYNLDP
jgi:hypothetical protein